jgi:diguanylate cyclase (GGDEF)-like protein/PAS domain S-box-containing protein
MYRVLTCLAVEHNWWLVGLAALVCLVSSYAVIDIGRLAHGAQGRGRLGWIAAAGGTAGFGVWATHFIAMLAYDPGVVIGYDTALTVASLAVAVVITAAGMGVALTVPGRAGSACGGIVFGLGIATMHYLGMASVQIPGRIDWSADLVVVSVVFGAGLSALAFLTARRRDRIGHWRGAALLAVAVCSLHFTGMGAITVSADPAQPVSASTMPPESLAMAVGLCAMLVLGFALFTAVMSRRSRAAQAEQERQFRILVEGVTDYALYMLAPDGTVANWNEGARRAKGYTAGEIVGRHFSCFYPEADRAAGLPEAALATARSEGRFEQEGWRLRKDSSQFWAHVVIDAIHGEDGALVGFAKITRDITERKTWEDDLRESSRRLDLALSNMSQGLCLFDADGRLILRNRRLATIFTWVDAPCVTGQSFHDICRLVCPDDATASEMAGRHLAIIRRGEPETITEQFGEGRIISLSHWPIGDGSWVTTCEDVTERRRSEARIAHMARHDGLTGLPNRLSFNAALDGALADAQGTGKLAVLGIDLDKFKEVNDLRGHAVGDKVLQTLASRLAACLRPGEMVARFGGDEFAAFKRFQRQEDLADFTQRLENALTATVVVDEAAIASSASIGIAIYPDDATGRDQLVNNADLAMYRAKGTIGQTVAYYEARMDEQVRQRRALTKELWAAIADEQFRLNYQVQKAVATGEITGYEALLRWWSPERGNVPPAEFIPVAESCGAIVPLGEWVLRTACREAAGWHPACKIAVNLSPLQLGQPDFVTRLAAILAETGLAPQRLELEITESTIIADKERALATLRDIKALGVTVAIDDFGTGYSSLETLRAFPFDKIKLDRSFMTEVETSPQAKAIVRAILALGRSLDVPVLAEGVETPDQLDLLAREGCDEAQGYLLGRPQPIGAIAGLRIEVAAPPLAPDVRSSLAPQQLEPAAGD